MIGKDAMDMAADSRVKAGKYLAKRGDWVGPTANVSSPLHSNDVASSSELYHVIVDETDMATIKGVGSLSGLPVSSDAAGNDALSVTE